MIVTSTFISLLLLSLAYLLSTKNSETEKLTAYECGFNPFGNIGNPISIRFWAVGVLFLLFDLEILFLMP